MYSKIIGTGSYGHVFFPCLYYLEIPCEKKHECEEEQPSDLVVLGGRSPICVGYASQKPTDQNHPVTRSSERSGLVSKLLKKIFAEKELSRYELIRIADPCNNFHLGNMFIANPSRRNIPLLSISDNGKEIIDHFDEYKLIIMKYGGKSLREYGNIIYNNFKNNTSIALSSHVTNKFAQNIIKFWKDSLRLIQGVYCFVQNNIVHHDIKTANIVFEYECKNRSNYIDFGLVQSMDTIYEKSKHSQYNYSIFYYNFPPEIFFYDKERFDTFRNLNMEERKEWFQYICTSWKTQANKHVVFEGQTLREANCLLPNIPDDSDDNDFDYSFMDSTNHAIKELKHTKILEDFLSDQTHSEAKLPAELVVLGGLRPLCEGYASQKPSDQNTEEKFKENFQTFLLHDIDKYANFKSFMKNSLYTMDIYGLGQSLLYMLIHTHKYLPKIFVEKMYILLHKMMHNNVTERITIKKLTQEYYILLQLLEPTSSFAVCETNPVKPPSGNEDTDLRSVPS